MSQLNNSNKANREVFKRPFYVAADAGRAIRLIIIHSRLLKTCSRYADVFIYMNVRNYKSGVIAGWGEALMRRKEGSGGN